jgi:hypothetical protein
MILSAVVGVLSGAIPNGFAFAEDINYGGKKISDFLQIG